MAKKRKPDGDRRKRSRPPATVPDLPDPRLTEGVIQQFVRSQHGGDDADSPPALAQALVYRALAEKDETRRVKLAQQALLVSPDCADAYVLLAEHAPSRKAARELYQQGVAAGERALGPQAFERDAGHFWHISETRPYLRARLGLAHALWIAGRRDEAVPHLQDMLRLNPGDNQGVRYTLAGFLLFLDRDDELRQLLGHYEDDASAAWAYTNALLAFRQQGDTIEARRALKLGKKTNKHVPDYLLGHKLLSVQPAGYSLGSEEEAILYAGGFLVGWRATPGAIAWLRANVKTKTRKADGPEPQGPLGFVKTWLKERLRQAPDVWQADCRQLPNWMRIGGEPVRPWVVLVTSRTDDRVLAHQMPDETPSAAALWDVLVQALRHPAAGEPHRPTAIEIRPDARWDSLRPHLVAIGVELMAVERLEHLDAVFDDLSRHVGGPPQPGLLDVPGVTPLRAGSFFEAAAFFFQQAPWKKVGYESAVQIECDKYSGGPWYAVLMGQSGLMTGLALYEDLTTLRRLWTRAASDEANARQTVATTVTFGEESDIAVADLEAARRYDWPVARPDAYPAIFHKERGLALRPPLAWELELMEGCLRAVPDFVSRRPQEDLTRETLTVPVASGQLQLTLAWLAEA